MKEGQINRGSVLGEKIFELSKRDDVRTILDIGTWNGMGSTKCIKDGILQKKPLKGDAVYSIECNKLRYEEAKINLGFLPPNFYLLHGTIVNAKELEPLLNTLENETLKEWLTEDINWLRITPNVLDKMPSKIDLCIIDGGEFSGSIEFFRLWERCRFIILDDTNAIKHKDTKKFIYDNSDKFNIIEDNTYERNGFLICENISINV